MTKQIQKWIVVLLTALVAGLGAGASAEGGEALAGNWSDGNVLISIFEDGSFIWQEDYDLIRGEYTFDGVYVRLYDRTYDDEIEGMLTDAGELSLDDGDMTLTRVSDMPSPNPSVALEGVWWHESVNAELIFDGMADFDYEDDDVYLYGDYEYTDGEYQLYDDEGNTHQVILYDDGSISLSFLDGYFWRVEENGEENGEVVFLPDDADLSDAPLGDGGGAEVVPGEPAEAVTLSGVEGYWYLDGDPESEYILLEGDTYQRFSPGASGQAHDSGVWTMGEWTFTALDDSTTTQTALSLDNPQDAFGGGVYYLLDDNCVLYDQNEREFFLHELLIGTRQGAELTDKYRLISRVWTSAREDGAELGFAFYDGILDLGYYVEIADGRYQQNVEIIGWWNLEDGVLTLGFSDGSEESFSYPCDSLTVQFLDGLTFSMESGR